jgi:hypothetical protein
MLLSRRSLISRGSTLLTGAVLLPLAELTAATTPVRFTASVPLSLADQTVLSWVRPYASAVRIVGSSVVGKLRGSEFPATHILARIENVALLAADLTDRLGLEGVTAYAHGNSLRFTFAETDYTIEILLPAAFTAALAARSARTATNFATDGVTWDPATGALTDPFHATGVKTLKLVNPGANVVAIFATLLRSLAESDTANVKFDVSFTAYWRRAMSRTALSVTDSAAICRELIQRLPELADRRTSADIAALLVTPLVTSSLRRQLRLVAPALVAQFTTLRAATPPGVSNAAVWLAILLAPQLRLGTAGAFAGKLEPEQQARFFAAVAEATQII